MKNPNADRWLRILAVAFTLGAAMTYLTGRPGIAFPYLETTLVLLGLGVGFGAGAVIAHSMNPSPVLQASGNARDRNSEAGGSTSSTWSASSQRPNIGFDDVAGLDEVLGDLRELVSYIRERSKYLELDAKLPRGVLLYGPPGTGKTLLAKALAGESEANFMYTSGSSFVEKYVGVGAQRVRDLFARARKQAPTVLFIDEIDSIGRVRGQGESNEWDTALNQLLTELDGYEKSENILLVAATNRKELLDDALLRPGRLDRQIYIGLPDVTARQSILKVHTAKKPLAAEVDLEGVARRTPGLSGAHLAAIANEAALLAARCGRPQIDMADFEAALDRVLAGETGRTNILAQDERRLVAHHEAGHAVAGWALQQGVIEKITLLSKSLALGYVLQVPEERALYTRNQLLARITVLLAGRAAELLVTGDYTTGAADDLRKATAIAEKMVTEFGMGRRHPHQVVRDGTVLGSRLVAAEVNEIIGQAWQSAQALVNTHRSALERLAATLLERETLTRPDLEAVLGDVRSVA